MQTAKKRDDIKINKVIKITSTFKACSSRHLFKSTHAEMNYVSALQAQEDVKLTKNIYEAINSDLKAELPVLFDRSNIKICLHDDMICADLRCKNKNKSHCFSPVAALDATRQSSHLCQICETSSIRKCKRWVSLRLVKQYNYNLSKLCF